MPGWASPPAVATCTVTGTSGFPVRVTRSVAVPAFSFTARLETLHCTIAGPFTVAARENSDVLPSWSVAVAVRTWPKGTANGSTFKRLAWPLASVATVVVPRNEAPSPKPVGSAMTLANHSRVNDRLATPSSVPRMIVCAADAHGRGDHGEVLQEIRPDVGVAWVVGRDAVVAQVDAEAAVVVDPIRGDEVAHAACDGHARPAIEGDRVGRARGRAADRRLGRDPDGDPGPAVAQRREAVGRRPDEVALDEVARAARDVDPLGAVAAR